ncbi:flavin reductase family protein [Arthrobacter psychrochitiniphilus]|uniref:flavin reductase family protein n=1 Tax=Arthrobacter psychrochitiniphilus TaxID=291045 RepID=UPI003F7BC6D1
MTQEIDPGLFRETLGQYPTGVAVVTATADDGSPVGMVVGTFSSVSMNPPLIAFFPMKTSRSFAQLRSASTFCINVLASDQEPLCRTLATGGANKFEGVQWRPGPLGSPILEGAAFWIESSLEEVREAGDHYIVLGRVQEFAVERSTLPLLFFQGGYGRFTPRSLVATPSPELIQAAQLAETIRAQVEELSHKHRVNCSVLAKIDWDAVQVLTANHGPAADTLPLGNRQPIIPPLGAAFLADSPSPEIEEWLHRATDDSQERRDLNLNLLQKVRDRNYSILASTPETLQRHQEALDDFELTDRLPRKERVIRHATSELTELFCPELLPGQLYDIASIVVPIPTPENLPTMAVRMTGLPSSMLTEQIEDWIKSLKEVAGSAANNLPAWC